MAQLVSKLSQVVETLCVTNAVFSSQYHSLYRKWEFCIICCFTGIYESRIFLSLFKLLTLGTYYLWVLKQTLFILLFPHSLVLSIIFI